MESGVSPAAICLQLIGLSAEQLYVLSAAAATVHALIALWIAFHAGLQCVCSPAAYYRRPRRRVQCRLLYAGEAPKAPKPPVLGRPCTAASSRGWFLRPWSQVHQRPPQTTQRCRRSVTSSRRSSATSTRRSSATSSRRWFRHPGRPPQTPSSHRSSSSRRRSRRCCRSPHVLAAAVTARSRRSSRRRKGEWHSFAL